MNRMTTDAPAGNFETMLNFVFSKDGWAYIRHDGEGESVPLTQWAKAQCILHGCGEFSAETPQEIDEAICDCMMDFPDCPIALAYCFASQAVHLRSRLKMYEDILFAEDGSELLTQGDLQKAVRSKAFPRESRNRFEQIRACQTPADMVVLLNGNERRFCPKEYGAKPDKCEEPCGQCISNWLEEVMS